MDTVTSKIHAIEKKAIDSIERERYADQMAEERYALIQSLNITDPERIARVAFQFGRAHGLQEATDMMIESRGLDKTV